LIRRSEEQRSFQRAVPCVAVPTELACGWLDDLYYPDSPAHIMAFSPTERTALAAFDVELRRWADKILAGDVEAFIRSAAGAALASAAAVALVSCEGIVAPN
jgi:hypothetical protein